MPIPLYESGNALHQRLAELGRAGEAVVADLVLRGRTHGAMRREVRAALVAGPGPQIDDLVAELLDGPSG